MPVQAAAPTTSIWSHAVTALSHMAETADRQARREGDQAGSYRGTSAGSSAGPGAHGPFQQLSSDLQAVLLQVQQHSAS